LSCPSKYHFTDYYAEELEDSQGAYAAKSAVSALNVATLPKLIQEWATISSNEAIDASGTCFEEERWQLRQILELLA